MQHSGSFIGKDLGDVGQPEPKEQEAESDLPGEIREEDYYCPPERYEIDQSGCASERELIGFDDIPEITPPPGEIVPRSAAAL
ncbi:MAG: hypothetical protein WDZ70_01100 [Candidatus Paceibacterota bacterium]